MRRLSLIARLSAGSFLVLSGCGGGDDDEGGPTYANPGLDPGQICAFVAADQCDRIYEGCQATPAQLQALGFPTSKLDCIGEAMDQLGCTSASSTKICQGSGAFGADSAQTCSAQVKAADCGKVTSSSSVSSYAPACGQCGLRP